MSFLSWADVYEYAKGIDAVMGFLMGVIDLLSPQQLPSSHESRCS